MTSDEMILMLKDARITELGRELFSHASDGETAVFLRRLLHSSEFTALYEIVRSQHISATALAGNSLDSEYFEMFIKLSASAGLLENEIMPLIVKAIGAKGTDALAKWNTAASRYLELLAERDYSAALKILTDCDPLYSCYEVLLKAAPQKTASVLADRLINQKGINKKAIRKFFLKTKPNITDELISRYEKSSAKERGAIVRLLLIYKHNARIAEFLRSAANDKSKTVRELINKDRMQSSKTTKIAQNSNEDFFKNLMINGTLYDAVRLKIEILSDTARNEIAETLFFAVHKKNYLADIAVIDKGEICSLDNIPLELGEDCLLSVLHPADIPSRYEFIKRLSIEQKSEQLKRRVFFAYDDEKMSGFSKRLSGTLLTVRDFKANLKKLPSKILQKESAQNTKGVILYLGEHAALIEFSPIDLTSLEQTLSFQDIKFYKYNNMIRIGEQCFFENAPKCPASEIPLRVFSEFMHSAYTLAGIISR